MEHARNSPKRLAPGRKSLHAALAHEWGLKGCWRRSITGLTLSLCGKLPHLEARGKVLYVSLQAETVS